MGLSKSDLKSNLKTELEKIFKEMKSPDGPKGAPMFPLPKKVADAMADAYDKYAKSAAAGPLQMSVPPVKATLAGLLVTPLMAGWGPGLIAYWSPVMWAGPGFIPANPTIPAGLASVAPGVIPLMAKNAESLDKFCDELATVLHSGTTALQVTATTLAGVPSVLPVA